MILIFLLFDFDLLKVLIILFFVGYIYFCILFGKFVGVCFLMFCDGFLIVVIFCGLIIFLFLWYVCGCGWLIKFLFIFDVVGVVDWLVLDLGIMGVVVIFEGGVMFKIWLGKMV